MKNRRKSNQRAGSTRMALMGTLLLGLVVIGACQSEPRAEPNPPPSPAIKADSPGKAQRGIEQTAATPTAPDRSALSRSEELTQSGAALYNKALYREARDDFKQALAANPDNVKARYLYNMCLVLLGEAKVSGYGSEIDLRAERYGPTNQELLAIRRLFEQGCELFEARDDPGAIKKFEDVLERIKWSPFKIDNEGLEERSRQKLKEARKHLADSEALQKESRESVNESRASSSE